MEQAARGAAGMAARASADASCPACDACLLKKEQGVKQYDRDVAGVGGGRRCLHLHLPDVVILRLTTPIKEARNLSQDLSD
jgi:hypothetical protein